MPHIINLKNKILESPPPTNKIEWSAFEFEKQEKNKTWLIVSGIIILLFLIIAVLLKNYTFVILILFSCPILYFYFKKNPQKINFSITPKGISINNKCYLHQDLKSFWIFYDPPRLKTLSIHSKNKFAPPIKIMLGDQNPVQIRSMLSKYIPEIEQEESLIDIISEKIGF